MIDGIPNHPLYFYQKDIIGCFLSPMPWLRKRELEQSSDYLRLEMATWHWISPEKEMVLPCFWQFTVYAVASYLKPYFHWCNLVETWILGNFTPGQTMCSSWLVINFLSSSQRNRVVEQIRLRRRHSYEILWEWIALILIPFGCSFFSTFSVPPWPFSRWNLQDAFSEILRGISSEMQAEGL